MRHLVVATICASTLAHAGPPEDRAIVAARAGASSFNWNDGGSGNYHDASAWKVELEGGVWFQPWLILAGFAGYASGRDADGGEDDCSWSDRDRFFDLGARMRVQTHGVFAGVGLGYSQISQKGSYSCPRFGQAGPDDISRTGTLWELHAGYTFPQIAACHCTPQIFAALGYTDVDNTNGIKTAQLEFGLTFW
ncbi:MAG TPA: outer membrane beta-barrel protein [Kofleriaceae bacterium]|nr:outer membrane beta-barrel protein [Kofleriaceae bacterium]